MLDLNHLFVLLSPSSVDLNHDKKTNCIRCCIPCKHISSFMNSFLYFFCDTKHWQAITYIIYQQSVTNPFI